MSHYERDTLKRQIRQLGEAIAAIVFRARAEGNYETGLESVRKAAEGGLGMDYATVNRLAPESAALLLRDPEVIRTYAWICAEEADLMSRGGEAERAAARARRAIDLYGEAARRDPSIERECRDGARALVGMLGAAGLEERSRRWLEAAAGEG